MVSGRPDADGFSACGLEVGEEMSDNNLFVRTSSGAEISPCRKYRYRLWREWEPGITKCTFVMLNPSTADEVNNDPTISRCERRAKQWGYGGIYVVNLFALRSTEPAALYAEADPVGEFNDAAILASARNSGVLVCAWGTHGKLHQRGDKVLEMLRGIGVKPHALRINADGSPAHPLYLPYSLLPEPMP